MRVLLLILFSLVTACPGISGDKLALRISGPPIAESIPLVVMAEQGGMRSQNFEMTFIPWHSPDMLRAMIAGSQVDAALVTTATASVLHNKGINCRMAMVYESPVWVVSRKPGENTLASLQGTLLFPFAPGEMPELFYKAAMTQKAENLVFRHTGSALEAVNLLLAGKADHALLSEPMASIALQRSKILQNNGAALLMKRVDMRKAWQKTFSGHGLALGGLAFFGDKANDFELIQAFNVAYEQACQWVEKNPGKALEIVRTKFSSLAVPMEQAGLKTTQFRILKGEKACEDALFFLQQLYKRSPASVGGIMPDKELFEIKK